MVENFDRLALDEDEVPLSPIVAAWTTNDSGIVVK